MLQIRVLATDLAATVDSKDRAAKRALLTELVDATRAIPGRLAAPGPLTALADLQPADPVTSAAQCVAALPELSSAATVAALVELVASTTWATKGLGFAGDRDALIADAARLLPGAGTVSDVQDIRKAYKSAVRRLRRDSTSLTTQATLGAVLATIAILTGGGGVDPASQAVGTWIGQQMGLSGAAATSAGLAWLGGGSLAAGGFGMAGGMFIVSTTTHALGKGTSLAIQLASTSSSAFIDELAKLDVVVGRGGLPVAEAVTALQRTEPELKRATDAARKDEGGYRTERIARLLGAAVVHPDKLAAIPADVRDELRKTEAGKLAAARRAVEYEIRHLTSEPWKRRIQQATRLLGLPALSKPLDHI